MISLIPHYNAKVHSPSDWREARPGGLGSGGGNGCVPSPL